MGCRPAFKVIDEVMNQKLGGDDADKSHVVLCTDGSTLAELVNEHRHCGSIENAVAAYLFVGEQIVHEGARGWLKKTAGFGGTVGLLMTVCNRRWNQSLRAAFQEVLFVKHFHFQRSRKFGGEFDHAMVKEGETTFYGVGHGHAVTLRRQDIAGKQVLRFEVLGLREAVPRWVRVW